MSWPNYPEREYEQRKKFGVYLEPQEEARAWGLRVHGVGDFTSRSHDMPSAGRVLAVYALVLVREGGGVLIDADGAETRLVAGDVLVVIPGWWHLYNPDPETGWTTAWIIFDGPVAESLRASGDLFPGVVASGVGDVGLQALSAILDGMISLAEERTDSLHLQARMAGELLGLLSRIADWRGQQARGNQSPQMVEAIDYVEDHYTEEIDFAALLDRSGLSSTHFRRQFKKATGDGPQAYQKRLRIRLAKELLRHSDLSVREIGAHVGYEKVPYFSRVFAKRVGVSPREWRASGG